MRIVVKCNGAKFRIGNDGSQNIRWLMDEVAQRYEKHKGLDSGSVSVCEVRAKDGSILGELDLISDACDDNEELEGIIAMMAAVQSSSGTSTSMSTAAATAGTLNNTKTSNRPVGIHVANNNNNNNNNLPTSTSIGGGGLTLSPSSVLPNANMTPLRHYSPTADAFDMVRTLEQQQQLQQQAQLSTTSKLSILSPQSQLTMSENVDDAWGRGSVLIRTFAGHKGGVLCLQILSDGNILCGGRDMIVNLFSFEGKLIRSFPGHTSIVRAVKMIGNKIVSTGDGIRIRDVDGSNETCITDHEHFVSSIDQDFNGLNVVTGSWDKTIKIWRASDWKCVDTLKGHTSAILCLKINRDTIASGSLGGELKFWSIGTKTNTGTVSLSTGAGINALCWIGSALVAAVDKMLHVVEVSSRRRLTTLNGHSDFVSSLESDGRWLLSASRDGTIRVWESTSWKNIRIISANGVRCLHVTSQGLLGAGCDDGNIHLWTRSDKIDTPTHDS